MGKEMTYLNAGVLTTTVNGLESGREGDGKDIAYVMVRVDGVETIECPCRPDLDLLSPVFLGLQ